jgi:hypothetical protein
MSTDLAVMIIKIRAALEKVPYFIDNIAYACIVCTFILQFYLNTLLMNKVGECYLTSIVRRQYFSIIFNEKSAHYTR